MATSQVTQAEIKQLARTVALQCGSDDRKVREFLAEAAYTNPTGFVARVSAQTGGTHYRLWKRELAAARKYWEV
jgi:hypothetical protein